MKKILIILTTILLSISIVGCSNSGKEYDSDIDKILTYLNDKEAEDGKTFSRKDINFEVYDVNYNLDDIKGKHNTYKVTYRGGKYNRDYTDIFIILKDKDKVHRFTTDDEVFIANMMQVKLYEETNNKELKAEF